jgi:hypothetical protein
VVLQSRVRLTVDDAASVAAHYGAVSAVTLGVVLTMFEKTGVQLPPGTT